MSRLGLLIAATFALVPLAAASCATTEAGGDTTPPTSPLPGPPDADAEPDALGDGGCDASDPGCVGEALSCAETSWCPVATGSSGLYVLTKVWGSGPNDVWAVGSGGTVIHWDGATWTPTPLPSSTLPIKNTFFSLWGSGPNDVWIASTTETIFRNTGGGWIKQPSPLNRDTQGEAPLYAMWGDSTGRLRFGTRLFGVIDGFNYLLCNQFTVEPADGGVAWKPQAGSATVRGYYGTSDDLWLIADNSPMNGWQRGVTQHGTKGDAGDALVFTAVESNTLAQLNAIWGSSADDIWVVGEQGVIRRMRPGQAAWEVIPPVTNDNLNAVWGTSASDVWAAGDNGTILHFDGTSWRLDTAAFAAGKTKPSLSGIWGSGPDDVWIVGGNVALHYTGAKAGGGK